jgi:hypothetical protein
MFNNDKSTVPEIIDPVFTNTSQNARFLLSENERFGLVFVKTGSLNSGTVVCFCLAILLYTQGDDSSPPPLSPLISFEGDRCLCLTRKFAVKA